MRLVDEESGKLPVWPEVEFLQKNSSSVADISQVSEATIDKPYVTFLLYLV